MLSFWIGSHHISHIGLHTVLRFFRWQYQRAFWERHRSSPHTPRPRQLHRTALERHGAGAFQRDVAALYAQAGAAGGEQEVLRGSDLYVCGDAGHRDAFVGADAGLPALALAAHFAAGGVQLDAGFLVGFAAAAGFAVGEQADAVFDQVVVVALGGQVEVAASAQAAAAASAEDGGCGGGDGDAVGAAELEQGLAVGGDLLVTGLQCVDVLLLLGQGGEFVGGGGWLAFGWF